MGNLRQMRDVCLVRIRNDKGRYVLKGHVLNRLFTRRLSIYFTFFFVQLGITANQVTLLMLLIGLGSFVCLLPRSFHLNIIGSLLMVLFFILDCADGEVARWQKKTSRGGEYLDLLSHAVLNYPVRVICALHLYIIFRHSVYSFAVLATMMASMVLYVSRLSYLVALGNSEQVGLRSVASSHALLWKTLKAVKFMSYDQMFVPLLSCVWILASYWEGGESIILHAGMIFFALGAAWGIMVEAFVSYFRLR